MKLLLLEAASYAAIAATWYLFRRLAGRNVTGDMLAGTIIGVYIEFATEPLWDYHFRLAVYKDTPLAIILGWGVMFTLTVFMSEKLYCLALRKPAVEPGDKRVFISDVIGGAMIGLPVEWLGLRLGIWDYRYDLLGWDWGEVPFFRMPYEALAGYALLMTIAPSFVRHWESPFEGGKHA